MSTGAENIAFIVVRGVVALAIVGVAFYCIAQGIHFFALPKVEAEQIHIHVIGLDVTASGLGAVIFGTGLALCFVGMRAAPRSIKITTGGSSSIVQTRAAQPDEVASTQSAPQVIRSAKPADPPVVPTSNAVHVSKETVITEASQAAPVRFD